MTAFAALVLMVTLMSSVAAFGQESLCAGDALASDAASEGRWQPCTKERPAKRGRGAGLLEADLNPSGQPRVVTPPGAVMKKVRPPDPAREERALQEKLHRALRKNDRGKLVTTPECQAVVQQIAEQQPMLRSLRTEARSQARDRVSALTGQFRELGCQDAR